MGEKMFKSCSPNELDSVLRRSWHAQHRANPENRFVQKCCTSSHAVSPAGGEAKTAVPYKVTERIIAVVQHVRAVPNCPTPSSTTSARQTARLCKPRKLYVSRRPSKPEGGRWTNAYDGARVAFLNDDELNAIFSPTSVNTSGCCNGFCVVDPAKNTKNAEPFNNCHPAA